MKKCVLTLAAMAALVLGVTVPASAQSTTTSPTFELSAGYQFFKTTGDFDQSYPLGFAVDAARNFGNLGVVAEGGWSYDSEDLNDSKFNLFTLAGGLRWTGRKSPKVWPYAQVLAGAAIGHSSATVLGEDLSDTETNFLLQPGAGVNFVVGDGLGVFGAVDYRRIFVEDQGVNGFRVLVGLRMILD